MKKKIVVLLLCMMSGLALAGCGTGKENSTETEASVSSTSTGLESLHMDIDLEECVTKLSDYNGIDLTVTGDYDVEDEDVEETVLNLLPSYGITGIEITDRDTVQEGDYVLIDYTGYKDGEAFSGGSATDVMFDVSNNYDVTSQSSYIDGFADGLFGAKVGDTASSDVTFPEDYSSEELAGQPATFEFTVKGIYEPVTIDNLTDEMVVEAFADEDESITGKDALLEYVRTALESQAENYKNQEKVSAAEEYLISNSTVEIPDAYFDARLAEYEANLARDYCEDGQTLEEFLEENGTSLDEMTDTWTESLTEQIQIEFLFRRIADIEGIEVDEDEFTQFVDYLVSSGGIDASTEDDVYDYYGNGNIEDGEQSLRELFRVNQAITFVVENANVTE